MSDLLRHWPTGELEPLHPAAPSRLPRGTGHAAPLPAGSADPAARRWRLSPADIIGRLARSLRS